MLEPILAALAAVGAASGVARSAVAYAAVSAAHVLGIALLLGPIALVDLRLLGFLRSLDAPALRVLRGASRLGLFLAVCTGVLLLSARPAEYAANPVVWAKLLVVAAGAVNAAAFELSVRRNGLDSVLDGQGRIAAGLSLTAWLAALALGRWIAFV